MVSPSNWVKTQSKKRWVFLRIDALLTLRWKKIVCSVLSNGKKFSWLVYKNLLKETVMCCQTLVLTPQSMIQKWLTPENNRFCKRARCWTDSHLDIQDPFFFQLWGHSVFWQDFLAGHNSIESFLKTYKNKKNLWVSSLTISPILQRREEGKPSLDWFSQEQTKHQ